MRKPDDLHRHASRAAIKIHEHLRGPGRRAHLFDLPMARWYELNRTMQLHQYAQKRAWHAASASLVDDLDYMLRGLFRELEALRGELPELRDARNVATSGAIAADLCALADEFEEVDIDLKEKSITVETAPIVLEGVELGAFQILLRWEKIADGSAYKIIAQQPNCPEGDSDVTHPHVRDDQLCEGVGAVPIRRALTAGRLLDFFLLVRQILQTYNAESAHVQLSSWSGVSCRDCGYRMPSGDYSSCERCDEPVCSDCSVSCDGCSRYVCSSCSGQCAQCQEQFCQACLTRAPSTNRFLCPSCLKEGESSHDQEECDPPAAADGVCLGQAAAAA